VKKTKLLITIILFATLNGNAQFTKLFDLPQIVTNGLNPNNGSLIYDGTYLYGMTPTDGQTGNGTIFKIMPDGTGFDTILNFNGKNGANPYGSLFYDGIFLYGLANTGGSHGYGNVFKIKPDGTNFDTLLNFDGNNGRLPNGALISDNTYLYGVTEDNVFKIKFNGTGYVNILDFYSKNLSYGNGPLFYDGTYLYGTTQLGGANNIDGIIYRTKPNGTSYKTLLDCTPFVTANNPTSSLISDGNFLYGMASGGINNLGVVFKIKPDGTNYTNLLNFDSIQGSYPYGSLILTAGYLFGMTDNGGINNAGVIFRIKPNGSDYTKLYDFDSINGSNPRGSLISDGNYLYGITSTGGANNAGTIFRIGINTVTGITDNKERTQVNIYPNPTADIINVQGQFENAQIKIYDVLGKSVYQNNSASSTLQIDLSNQPNGIYFLSIQTSEGTVNKKIVISH
jgi:uncharacterized repeat protein (TIGR03803 family)